MLNFFWYCCYQVEFNRFETLFSCFCCQTFLFSLELFRKRFFVKVCYLKCHYCYFQKRKFRKKLRKEKCVKLGFLSHLFFILSICYDETNIISSKSCFWKFFKRWKKIDSIFVLFLNIPPMHSSNKITFCNFFYYYFTFYIFSSTELTNEIKLQFYWDIYLIIDTIFVFCNLLERVSTGRISTSLFSWIDIVNGYYL